MSNKTIVVWDLDGTLACGKHRLHLLPTENLDNTQAWYKFNMACGGDSPIRDNIELCNSLEPDYFTIILTGRSDDAVDITEEWLLKHDVEYGMLVMRSKDDHRPDIEFKEEKLREIGLSNILCCFDDLEHVVKHIRSLGVTCHQVTHYDVKHAHTKSQEENINGTCSNS